MSRVETPSVPPENYLEVAHVAHRLKVSQEFVRRLLRARRLAAVRLGRRWRVEESALAAYLERNRLPSLDDDSTPHQEAP